MDLPELPGRTSVSDDVAVAARELVALKARTREMGSIAVQGLLLDFVEAELLTAEATLAGAPSAGADVGRERAWALAEAAFLRLIGAPAGVRQGVG